MNALHAQDGRRLRPAQKSRGLFYPGYFFSAIFLLLFAKI